MVTTTLELSVEFDLPEPLTTAAPAVFTVLALTQLIAGIIAMRKIQYRLNEYREEDATNVPPCGGGRRTQS